VTHYRLTIGVWLFLYLCGPLAWGQETATPATAERFHIFLLWGQSNMAGRGKVEPADKTPHPRVKMLDQAGEWQPASDPLHFDKPRAVGVGPGKTFAIEYAQTHPEVTVGLVPCAAGGSSIDSWTPGGYHSQTQSHPYDDAISRARIALAAGTLKGILWHQGESDCNARNAPLYADKLKGLIERSRRELSAPDVPFFIGQLGNFPQRPWSTYRIEVDAAQQRIAREVPQVEFVSSKGLMPKADQVHFNAASARELGHRYFLALQRWEEKNTQASAAAGDRSPVKD